MPSLLIRLEGPLQSWGVQSRFGERDTGLEPSKSGVVGVCCAALGIRRDDDERIAEITRLAMAVRVDREGVPSRDFQTAGGGTWHGRHYGVYKASGASPDTVTSNRWYLADASFLVALSGTPGLLEALAAGFRAPVWALYLGRMACVPSVPIAIQGGLRAGEGIDELRRAPWRPTRTGQAPSRLRLIVECRPDEGEAARPDVPLSFVVYDRRYAMRYTRTEWVAVASLPRE